MLEDREGWFAGVVDTGTQLATLIGELFEQQEALQVC